MLTSPPLSFVGNKKNYRKLFIQQLKDRYDSSYTFVDLFGGSCFLSYLTKVTFPESRVICNDFDDYSNRLKHIPDTNRILAHIKEIIGDTKKSEKLSTAQHDSIIDYLRKCESEGMYVDCITISASICFSTNFRDTIDKLTKTGFYNCTRKNDYDLADNYLDGIELVRKDYIELYDQFKSCDKVVFIMDPPYLSSLKLTYTNEDWNLSQYVKIFDILQEQKNWIFFFNGESGLKDLLMYLDTFINDETKKIYANADIYERKNQMNFKSKFIDIMMVRTKGPQELCIST